MSEHTETDARRCIALTDRHTQCKGNATQGREFCKRHTPRQPRLALPSREGES